MFDSTGIVEIFVSRIDTQERNPRYLPPSPVLNENASTSLPPIPTQDIFALNIFLTEKFDCMANDTVKVTFSLSSGTASTVKYFQDLECPCKKLPTASPKHGCFEELERVAFQDAVLGPVNCDGWPLEGGEVDEGCIVLTFQRGTLKPCGPLPTSKYRFVPSAGADITVTFEYRSRYRGLVELLSTTTFSSCDAPSLQLTRRPNGLSVPGKRVFEVHQEENDPEDGKSKKLKLASDEAGVEHTARNSDHPFSSFWSEEST